MQVAEQHRAHIERWFYDLPVAMQAVLADAAGQGPRHEQWRQRVVNRIRWRH